MTFLTTDITFVDINTSWIIFVLNRAVEKDKAFIWSAETAWPDNFNKKLMRRQITAITYMSHKFT